MMSIYKTPVLKFATSQTQVAPTSQLQGTTPNEATVKSTWTRDFSTIQSKEVEACFRLRHAYFVRERGWVGENHDAPGIEKDEYDPHALHLGVWRGDELAAYLRLLPFDPGVGFMIDRDLKPLLSEQERRALPRENAVEISRLCRRTDQNGEDGQGSAPDSTQLEDVGVMELLFKQLYQVSLERGFTRFYIVVEAGWLRFFARRFGVRFRSIGKPCRFPDGTRTVAATASLEELEVGMRRYSEAKFAWYRQVNDGDVENGSARESKCRPTDSSK